MKGTTRIKILSVVFVLLAVVAWFALKEKSATSTMESPQELVSIEDTASVNKVTIRRAGSAEVLTRTAGGWVINGKYKTAIRPSTLLLLGLNQLQIKRPVSGENSQKVYRDIMEKGTLVSVEYGGNKKELRFLSNPGDPNTTYLVPNNSKTAYVAYVPGIKGNINNLFNLTENDWRNRKLFASPVQDIIALKVSYPKNPGESFEIHNQNGAFLIPGMTNTDSVKVETYIRLFQNAPLAYYLSDKKDSAESLLRKAEYLAKIELSDRNEQKNASVEIYNDPSNAKIYLGKLPQTGEPVALNRELFDALLVKKSYFQKR